MIRLENVNKYFNRYQKNEIHVINNTTLTLEKTGLVALIGPSGCGKTTLLNAIGGLDKVNKGNIYVNGKRITKRNAGYIDKVRSLNVGYIFQNYYLLDNKTVFENVAIALRTIGIKNKKEIKKRVEYVLDTLGMYRYRNRLASMLSGGQRQRVGIARAIVKNPNIIIADEPTGNLDSRNTIEIMNIIKSIAKNRLVILVTHENELAKFYADRILELEDGVITKDYKNKHNDTMDYRIENEFYLKDFKFKTDFENKDNKIRIYNDKQNDIKLTIVVKNNNIYIKGGKNDKLEIVDDESNIKFIDDHYKKIDKSMYEKYEFNFENIIDKNIKLKYSSILNIFSLIFNGFKKILDYSIIKKLLLLGFLAAGCFITYSTCNIFGLKNIKDEYFVTKNPNYYDIKINKIDSKKYLEMEKIDSVDYLLPGDTQISFGLNFPYYYQTTIATGTITGSLTANDQIKEEDIILGKMPSDKYEIVVDTKALNKILELSIVKHVGIKNKEDLLNIKCKIRNMQDFTIVGITDLQSPSIYADKDILINILYGNNKDYYDNIIFKNEEQLPFKDLSLEEIKLKQGKIPDNDYEVMVNYKQKDEFPLNKNIDEKIGNKKLKVVGYYEVDNNDKYYYVTKNTLKLKVIDNAKDISIMPKNETVVQELNEQGYNIISSYKVSKDLYTKSQSKNVKAGLIASGIVLVISFIEIYLMIRASFLSRIKEIGIYRAIGVKKIDIYKMFYGEIFALTTIACVPGWLFVLYALNSLKVISYFERNYLVNPITALVSLVIIYVFNLVIGLLPVHRVVRQTPAQILARKDID